MPATAVRTDISSTQSAEKPPMFSGIGMWVDAHPRLTLAILFAIYICAQLGYSLRVPLWHDELFTYYIAQAPTVRDLLHLTRTVDLNPPLSYLMTRITFHVFGIGSLQTRLPEMLGYALAFVGLFVFVRRRAGNSAGVLSAAILLASKATEPAIDGRPYGLMFGFGMLALLAWQSSTIAQNERRSTIPADLALALTTSALLLTHIFGAFVGATLAVAEAVHIWEARRFNFSRALALLLPLAATWTWIPLFRLHTEASYPPAFQAHLSQVVSYYAERLSRECIVLVCTGILLAILAGHQYLRRAASFAFTGAELAAALVIAASPILLIARLAAGHAAFFYRYGDICLLGFAILITAAVLRLTGNRSTPAVLAAIMFLMVSSRWQHAVTFAAQGQIFRHTEPPLIPYHPETVASKPLPIVINSGIVFLEMNNHEPLATLSRTYYLTGGQIALRYTNATIFEGAPKVIAAFHLAGHSEPYLSFVREHHEFYLLASDHDFPEDWLLRKLHDDGATLTLAGHVENNYRDHNIYDVTMPSLR